MTIKSERAKKLLEQPVAFKSALESSMRKYPGTDFSLWAQLELGEGHVKNLSFFGEVVPLEKLIFEATARLIMNKSLSRFDSLSVRECEAFLRDRNSEAALEYAPELEDKFKKVFQWLKAWPSQGVAKNYEFSSEKGKLAQLKLVDRVRELKAFLSSSQIQELYQETARPELVDVDDLTVYVQVPYDSEREKELFHELHLLGVEAFQEENLNFIPEP